MEVALIGKAGLIADVGYLVPGAQAAPGVLDPRHIDKAGRRQAGILLKGADQGLFAQRKFVGQRIQRKRYRQARGHSVEQPFAAVVKAFRWHRA